MQKIARSSIRATRFLAPRMMSRFASMSLGVKSTSVHPLMVNVPRFSFSNLHENVSRSSHEGPGFYMEQMLTGCLSLYSYYIESGNDAFLIDPLNETEKYHEIMKKRGKTLKGVFLTHYHADYIAGHIEIKKKYNCDVYMGPTALNNFDIKVLKDNEEIKVGNVKLQLIHTPGHT